MILLAFLSFLVYFNYWSFKAANWKISAGLYVMLSLDFLIILVIIITRPFDFGSVDANNLILYGIYLATSGALFSVPVSAKKEEIFSGNMPKELKNILMGYLAYSVLLLIMIGVEAYKLRG